MSERSFNPEAWEGSIEGAAKALVRRHGMEETEARTILGKHVGWMQRLMEDDTEGVVIEVLADFSHNRTVYGPSQDWDEPLIMVGLALITTESGRQQGAALLAQADDVDYMMESVSIRVAEAVRRGNLGVDQIFHVSEALQEEFVRQGREREFLLRGLAGLGKVVETRRPSPPTRAAQPSTRQATPSAESAGEWNPEPETLTTDTARELYTRASWEDITALTDEHWPQEMDAQTRQGIAHRFARMQHDMLDKVKIERKDVEALKAFLREHAAAAPAMVWDYLRFTATRSLYVAEVPNFGRGMARSMDNPAVMGAVVHALIDHGREKEAMDVANDIPHYPTRAKVLYTGEWQDRAAVEALLEDITHATQKTHRKYDPELRVGIAIGLQELFAFNADSAAVANNPTESARWQAEADKMAGRVALLQRQIASGFIKPPKK